MNYRETLEYLDGVSVFSVKHSNEHTARMLARLGHPENRVPVIHVAGTNGKGSTSALMASVLQRSGRKTALFVSPHLVRITERMQIDGREISEDRFAAVCTQVRKASERAAAEGDGHPSWFEFLFLAAMLHFAEEKTDIAVIETGLGGRLDATNAVPRPLISVITPIGRDHMQYLGETIPEIAFEKAGILKKNVPACAMQAAPEAEGVICERAAELGIPLALLCPDEIHIRSAAGGMIDFSLPFRYDGRTDFSVRAEAFFQASNAALALRALATLRERDPDFADLTADQASEALAAFQFPARMQRLSPHVLLDGAHNPHGLAAALASFDAAAGERKRVLVFAAMRDKQLSAMVALLAEYRPWKNCILTEADAARGCPSEELPELFAEYGLPAEAVPDLKEAYRKALLYSRDAEVLICGSLYLAGAVLKIHQTENQND